MSTRQNHESEFSQSETAEQLKLLTRTVTADREFDHKWQTLLTDFQNWENSPSARQTSRLNVQLKFLRCLCAAFPDAKLNMQTLIAELVLAGSGARNVGDTLSGKQPDGTIGRLRVVRREITDEFGILYTLETPAGIRFTREFFE